MRRKGLFTLSVVLLSACWLLSVPAVMASTFTDFTNTSLWGKTFVGTGISVNVLNDNTVDVILPQNLTPVGNNYSGGLTTKVPVTGDFDYQVNYKLLNWPSTPNGVRMGIQFGDGSVGGSVERVSWEYNGNGEVYLTDFHGFPYVFTYTADTSGALRIARTGNTVTGYYLNGSTWVVIESYSPATTADITFALAAWGPHDSFSPNGQDVTVEFSSVPLPPTMLLFGSGLVGLGLLRRKWSLKK